MDNSILKYFYNIEFISGCSLLFYLLGVRPNEKDKTLIKIEVKDINMLQVIYENNLSFYEENFKNFKQDLDNIKLLNYANIALTKRSGTGHQDMSDLDIMMTANWQIYEYDNNLSEISKILLKKECYVIMKLLDLNLISFGIKDISYYNCNPIGELIISFTTNPIMIYTKRDYKNRYVTDIKIVWCNFKDYVKLLKTVCTDEEFETSKVQLKKIIEKQIIIKKIRDNNANGLVELTIKQKYNIKSLFEEVFNKTNLI